MKTTISVDPQEIAFFSALADEWWNESGKFKPLHQIGPARLEFIRDHACRHFGRNANQPTPLQGLSALDIGCGGGLVSEPLARLGANMTGIDAAEKNIAVATRHAQAMNLPITYRHATAEALVEEGRKFDMVMALEIVEHVADVPGFIKSCADLVAPGGLLFMSTLNRTFKSFAMAIVGAEYVLRWLPRGTHHWEKFLRPGELATHLRRAGLQTEDVKGIVFNPLRQRWTLSSRDFGVNYLLVAKH